MSIHFGAFRVSPVVGETQACERLIEGAFELGAVRLALRRAPRLRAVWRASTAKALAETGSMTVST